MNSPLHAAGTAPLARKEWILALCVTSSYVALTLSRSWLRSVVFGYDGPLTFEMLGSNSMAYFGPTAMAGFIPFCLILTGQYRGWLPRLRETGTTSIALIATAVLVLLGSYVLATLNVWPFAWQGPSSTNLLLGCWIKSEGHLLEAIVWSLHAALLAPVVEEWIFRRWIPTLVTTLRAPTQFVILVPSALFALGHLGTIALSSFTYDTLLQMSWLFLGAATLTYGTVKRGWRLTGPIVAHTTRNFADLMLLFLARC